MFLFCEWTLPTKQIGEWGDCNLGSYLDRLDDIETVANI